MKESVYYFILVITVFWIISCTRTRKSGNNLQENCFEEEYIMDHIDSIKNISLDTIVFNNEEILNYTDRIELIRKEGGDRPDRSSIWVRNKEDGKSSKLFDIVPFSEYGWYIGDGKRFIRVSSDTLPVCSNIHIYNTRPLQIIVEGCPDLRNIYSFFIDVNSKKTWYVPSNSGYLGDTEEGYMIFKSYRYVSDPDIAGRYTFLQIFNERGLMVDSLSLEHLRLEGK